MKAVEMKSLLTLWLVLTSVALVAPSCGAGDTEPPLAPNPDGEWTPLFNGKDMTGFDTFLGAYTADQLNTDEANIITVHDGLVHIYKDTEAGSKVPFGYFSTKKEYSHFHLRFEYKWGEKKFAPRTAVIRDAGVIYHMVGPHKVWPRGVECQVQEGDTGDNHTVYGTRVTTTVDPVLLKKKKPVFKFLANDKGGVAQQRGTAQVARVVHGHFAEREGWNTVEVIVNGSNNFVHIVNGVVNNWGSDIRELDESGENWVPLSKGRILFQVEGAEVLYRNIELKELPPTH